jgi:hypothetical protein
MIILKNPATYMQYLDTVYDITAFYESSDMLMAILLLWHCDNATCYQYPNTVPINIINQTYFDYIILMFVF